MSRHLAAAAAGTPLGKVRGCQVSVRNASRQHHGSVAVVREEIIVFFHQHRDDGQSLVAHSSHLKPAFALPKQHAFAPVTFAAQVHELQKV